MRAKRGRSDRRSMAKPTRMVCDAVLASTGLAHSGDIWLVSSTDIITCLCSPEHRIVAAPVPVKACANLAMLSAFELRLACQKNILLPSDPIVLESFKVNVMRVKVWP